MRPLTLTFSGLRSYRDTTTIDFSRLDLVAVIGDTGAGKSTIIEALSLALYGRKSWSGGANLDGMIADGLNTMRVALTFVAGGEEWTVTRARHRNASAPVDKLVAASVAGRNVDGSRAVTERITELVGLTHEQFTRAVVLPQGRFDELLRASERERSQIISSILGLGEIAATRDLAAALLATWNERAILVRAQRSHLPADVVGELAVASTRAADAAERVATLTVARDDAVVLDRRAAARREELTRVADALASVPAPDGDAAAELGAARARALELHAGRRAAEVAAATADAALLAIDARVTAVLDGFANRDRMVAAREALVVLAQSIDKDIAAAAALEAELAAHLAVPPPASVDPALERADAVVARHVEDTAAQAVAAEVAAREAAAAWTALRSAEEVLAAARAAVDAAGAPIVAAAAALVAAEAELAGAERRLAAAEQAERDALVAGAVAAVAGGCAAGDDCPVCGRELPEGFEPPAPPDDPTVDGVRPAAAADVATARTARDHAARAVFQAEHRREAARTAADAAAVAAAAADGVVAGLGIDRASADPLASFMAAVEEADAAVAAARAVRHDAGQALAVATAGLAAARRAHDDRAASIRADLLAARSRLDAHAALVDRLPAPWRPTLDQATAEAVLARVDEALTSLDDIEADRDAARAAAAAGHGEVQAIGGLLSREVEVPVTRTVGTLDARARRVGALAGALAGTADPPGDLVAPDVVGDVAAADDPDVLGALVEVAVANEARAAATLAAAERIAADLSATHDAARAELDRLLGRVGASDLDALHAAVGRAGAEREAATAAVVRAEAAVAEVARIEAVRAVLDPFVANLKVLTVALRDQHFLAHLVRARESELLAEATRRLKDITGGRFGFTAGFGVVDVASGEVRTPDTLSGGERFQAALALALGLVEIASRGGGKLDAVFVDEGFGSLDSNALETALDTLGKVAGGGKLVALISHLRPVAEYVDTVLHVTRDDVLGSRIEVLDTEAREQLLADDIRSGLTA